MMENTQVPEIVNTHTKKKKKSRRVHKKILLKAQHTSLNHTATYTSLQDTLHTTLITNHHHSSQDALCSSKTHTHTRARSPIQVHEQPTNSAHLRHSDSRTRKKKKLNHRFSLTLDTWNTAVRLPTLSVFILAFIHGITLHVNTNPWFYSEGNTYRLATLTLLPQVKSEVY